MNQENVMWRTNSTAVHHITETWLLYCGVELVNEMEVA